MNKIQETITRDEMKVESNAKEVRQLNQDIQKYEEQLNMTISQITVQQSDLSVLEQTLIEEKKKQQQLVMQSSNSNEEIRRKVDRAAQLNDEKQALEGRQERLAKDIKNF